MTEKCDECGGHGWNSAPVQNARSLNKYLSLDFIGMVDGIWYFKPADAVGPVYAGDQEDYDEWRTARKKLRDIIDADAVQKKVWNAATKGKARPSPHPWLDASLKDLLKWEANHG